MLKIDLTIGQLLGDMPWIGSANNCMSSQQFLDVDTFCDYGKYSVTVLRKETWSDLPFVELLQRNKTLLKNKGKKRIMLATATAPSSWKRMLLLHDTCTKSRGNPPPQRNLFF